MAGSRSRDFLRRESRCDRAGRFVLSRPRYEGRRPAATPRVRATLAPASARGLFGYRADFAGRQPRHLLLPAWLAAALDDRARRALARVSPGVFRIAASELAHDPLAARQCLVRERSLAGTALPGRQSARNHLR